jgi:hypothetical protein
MELWRRRTREKVLKYASRRYSLREDVQSRRQSGHRAGARYMYSRQRIWSIFWATGQKPPSRKSAEANTSKRRRLAGVEKTPQVSRWVRFQRWDWMKPGGCRRIALGSPSRMARIAAGLSRRIRLACIERVRRGDKVCQLGKGSVWEAGRCGWPGRWNAISAGGHRSRALRSDGVHLFQRLMAARLVGARGGWRRIPAGHSLPCAHILLCLNTDQNPF